MLEIALRIVVTIMIGTLLYFYTGALFPGWEHITGLDKTFRMAGLVVIGVQAIMFVHGMWLQLFESRRPRSRRPIRFQ